MVAPTMAGTTAIAPMTQHVKIVHRQRATKPKMPEMTVMMAPHHAPTPTLL